jgi:hypothetical protein
MVDHGVSVITVDVALTALKFIFEINNSVLYSKNIYLIGKCFLMIVDTMLLIISKMNKCYFLNRRKTKAINPNAKIASVEGSGTSFIVFNLKFPSVLVPIIPISLLSS